MDKWLRQSGLLKQLELYLSLALIIIALLIYQLISANKKFNDLEHKLRKAGIQIEGLGNQGTKVQAESLIKDEKTIKDFINKYLGDFFKTDSSAEEYLLKHSNNELFSNNIKVQISKRRELKINSEFKLHDIYVEYLENNQAKVIATGTEVFPNKDYQNRNFTIELTIDAIKLEVINIPVFEVK